jgi:hypothetical protein
MLSQQTSRDMVNDQITLKLREGCRAISDTPTDDARRSR